MSAPPIPGRAAPRRRAAGASQLEFGVFVAIVALLGGMFLQHALSYRDEAERAEVMQVAGALRTALQERVAELHLASREADIGALAGRNPMAWLERPPANYLGDYYAPGPGEVQPGNWYFDRANGTLVYLPRGGGHAGGSGALRFRVELLAPRPSGQPDAAPKVPDGVALRLLNG